jgi:hypothetical protein
MAGSYDLNKPLMDVRGNVIGIKRDNKQVDLTVADACLIGLLDHPVLGENGQAVTLTGVEKFNINRFAGKIVSAKEAGTEINLTVDEVAMLKKAIGDHFTPSVVGAVWSVLES